MNDPTHDEPKERKAHLRDLLGTMRQSTKQDPSKHLGEVLLALQAEPRPALDGDKNDNGNDDDWFERIDKAIRSVDIDLIAMVVLIVVMLLLIRSCGG